ncbi:MAG: carbohydrate ABC transporter permease [Spirochaetia bacterium]|jgi:ABC-type glycerol-3-phosphate transport system permease component
MREAHRGAQGLRATIFWLVIVAILLFFLFPPIWLFMTSIKTFRDAFAIPPKLLFTPTIENYLNVFATKQIQAFLLNSIIISASSTAIALLIGIPAAYALARFEFAGKKNLSFFILSVRIAPPIMTLFPLYILFNRLNLIGTRLSVIVMYVVFNLPLAVWIMQIFFRDISGELRDAALIDGCSELRVLLRVMLPLVRSGLSATSILCVIQAWNEYLLALVLTSQKSQTMPVAITSFMTYSGIEWGPISAAGVVVMVPMIAFGLMVQKNLVRGLTLGAVKG